MTDKTQTPEKTPYGNKYTAPPFSKTNQPAGRGRPKGSYSPTKILKKLLEAGKGKEAEAFAKAVIKHAKKGQSRYAQIIFDRVDGVLKQELGIDGELGLNVNEMTEARKKELRELAHLRAELELQRRRNEKG